MQRDTTSIAIVGLGPRGINVLERITAHASDGKSTPRLEVHLIDPGVPGAGIHYPSQPDYLLLNTVASQITMFMDPTIENAGPLLPGPSLYEWATGTQYLDSSMGPNSYLPRRLFGEYLNWVFHYLVLRLERYCEVHLHPSEAIDLHRRLDHTFTITLAEGGTLAADYVFLTTGHAENQPDRVDQERGDFVSAHRDRNRFLDYVVASPYPIDQKLKAVSPATSVAIEGMGLTAIDAIAALTVGRGGQFHRNTDTGELMYRPSGQEPALALYSRSGLPLSARAENQKGVSDQYQARFLTQTQVAQWKLEKGPGDLDFFTDIFPLLVRDMAHAYYLAHARQRHGEAFAALLDETLIRLDASTAETVLKRCCPGIPPFSWNNLVNPIPEEAVQSREAYQVWLRTFLEYDLQEARRGNIDSPLKAACDVLRDVRDNLRNAIDFGSLSSESHHDFMTKFVPAMNRLAVGPPLERVEEWLALAKAGYLDIGFGPGAYASLDPERAAFEVKSPLFPESTFRADVLVRARVPKSSPAIDRSAFTQRLLEQGLIQPFCNGEAEIGGIEVDSRLHIVTANGEPLHNAWALGTVCEGAKFYTYIVPRPYVNSTALVDAGRTVGELFANIRQSPATNEKFMANIAV
ncbi:FAD-NAD(P)-binding protein [Modicisalibacter xianhensis]|uniref:FAD-NAD(P)-binding protein n=1 Tax=Modicisalibacter xianhensis TaxID=442341 RepID=A0A4R8FJ67_9GAMM|nr:FAD/NAD(P)-binding protein [Halomonas xianhensis]TDX23705.1 FAD-NAD(P)-binding protein [Halomonas xianhensis]